MLSHCNLAVLTYSVVTISCNENCNLSAGKLPIVHLLGMGAGLLDLTMSIDSIYNNFCIPTLCVRSVDMQNPLCAFQTFTVVSDEAEITKKKHYK